MHDRIIEIGMEGLFFIVFIVSILILFLSSFCIYFDAFLNE